VLFGADESGGINCTLWIQHSSNMFPLDPLIRAEWAEVPHLETPIKFVSVNIWHRSEQTGGCQISDIIRFVYAAQENS
jgi:hypothetical protein